MTPPETTRPDIAVVLDGIAARMSAESDRGEPAGQSVLRSIRFGHSPCTPRQRLPLQTRSGCRVNSNERNTL